MISGRTFCKWLSVAKVATRNTLDTSQGVVTAVALVLYFLAAVGAHIRVRDHDPGRLANVLTFLVLAVAALVSSVLYHVPW